MSATENTVKQEIKEEKNLWDGGRSPFKASYGKIMMWYFLISDTFSFAGLLLAYAAIRLSAVSWPDPHYVFTAFPGMGDISLPLMFVSLMTFILILSSVTMVRAVQEGVQLNKSGVVKWLSFTIIGGILFLLCQAWEWSHMINAELPTTIYENPFGAAAGRLGEAGSGNVNFGQFFFVITGFHGMHVLVGVLINSFVLVNVLNDKYQKLGNYEIVEKVGLYWHFVDLVWVFVFLAFYLI
ncbi:MAG: cytochrome oxidase subunit III [Chitinophagaceae bacterium]|nr:MAG: cytochrome oxidase subunit III [Chitinophagaceae bacterium]